MQVQESDKPSWKSFNLVLGVIALLLVGAGACIICDIINKAKANFDWYDLGGLVFIVMAIVLVGVVLVQSAVVRERAYAICPFMRPKKGNMVAREVFNNDTSNSPKPIWTPTALAETGIVVLLIGVATIQIADMVKDANNDKSFDGFSLGATVCTCLALLCTFWLISQTVVIRNKCRTLCPLVAPFKEINGVTYQNEALQTQQYNQNMQNTQQQPGQVMQNTQQQPGQVMQNTQQQPGQVMQNTQQQPGQVMQNTQQQPGQVMQNTQQQPGQVMHQASQQPGHVMQNMQQQPGQVMHQASQQPGHVMQNMQQQPGQVMHQASQQPGQQPGQVMHQASQQASQQARQQQLDGLNQGLHGNSVTHGLQGGRKRK